MTEAGLMNVTIKRKSKKTSGFEVEKGEDGFYYVTKVPPKCKTIGVGDRVLEINGTTHTQFKTSKNANTLLESIRLDVVPAESDDEESSESEAESDSESEEEEYEEVSRLKNKTKLAAAAAAATTTTAAAAAATTTKKFKKKKGDNNSSEEEDDWDDSSEDRGKGKAKNKAKNKASAAKRSTKKDDDDSDDDSDNSGDDSDGGGGGGDNDDSSSSDEEGKKKRDLVKTSAAKRNKKISGDDDEEENWDRPYVSKYSPNERFMITIAKKDVDDDDLGLELVEFKSGKGKFARNDIFVKAVDRGPFYDTALDRGDKVLSINGKKVPDKIKSVGDAMKTINAKSKISVFAVRTEKSDKGYKWLMENH